MRFVVSRALAWALAIIVCFVLIRDLYLKHRLVQHVRDGRRRIARTAPSRSAEAERETRKPAGTGVIVVGGGPKYGPMAESLIDKLHSFPSRLPVELWCVDQKEFEHESVQRARARSGVTVRIVREEYPEFRPAKANSTNGYRSKALALARSNFRHVLLIDADNIPLTDPAVLFQSRAYAESGGALLWPDRFTFKDRNYLGLISSCRSQFVPMSLLYSRLGLVCPPTQFESGQILIDRVLAGPALPWIEFLNIEHRPFYSCFHGDKDSYEMAFQLAGTKWSVVPAMAKANTARKLQAFVQLHPDDLTPFFVHFASPKQKEERLSRSCQFDLRYVIWGSLPSQTRATLPKQLV